MVDRVDEVRKHVLALGLDLDEQWLSLAAVALRKAVGKSTSGCISPGGSAVRSWLQYWLFDNGFFKVGGQSDAKAYVTCVFHFWPWDCAKYGPQPKGCVGTNQDTMRSPVWRICAASPINRVACKVTGQKMLE